jgi:hypothetical protein
LIAAEQLNRRAFLMELDPLYCDVIVSRYETFSGKKAQRGEGQHDDLVLATALATWAGEQALVHEKPQRPQLPYVIESQYSRW